jgi:hypothetical protein
MTNQTIYPLTKLTNLTLMTTLTLMTSFFDLNYYKDFRMTNQTHNSYPDLKNLGVKVLG